MAQCIRTTFPIFSLAVHRARDGACPLAVPLLRRARLLRDERAPAGGRRRHRRRQRAQHVSDVLPRAQGGLLRMLHRVAEAAAAAATATAAAATRRRSETNSQDVGVSRAGVKWDETKTGKIGVGNTRRGQRDRILYA